MLWIMNPDHICLSSMRPYIIIITITSLIIHEGNDAKWKRLLLMILDVAFIIRSVCKNFYAVSLFQYVKNTTINSRYS